MVAESFFVIGLVWMFRKNWLSGKPSYGLAQALCYNLGFVHEQKWCWVILINFSPDPFSNRTSEHMRKLEDRKTEMQEESFIHKLIVSFINICSWLGFQHFFRSINSILLSKMILVSRWKYYWQILWSRHKICRFFFPSTGKGKKINDEKIAKII